MVVDYPFLIAKNMNNPKASEIKNLCDEKGISLEDVIEAVEAALAAAYRKDFGEKNQNIKVEFDIKSGVFRVFDVKTVVEDISEEELQAQEQEHEERASSPESTGGESGEDEQRRRFNPKTEIMISEAKEKDPSVELDQEIRTELPAHTDEFGRMAAQTAKQVLIQKIREAERNMLFSNFKDKEDTIVIGTVQRREDNRVLVDFGKVSAVLPISEQIPRERYNQGDRIKVYVVSVGSTTRGPEILISRTHPNMVKKIFESEIPEVANGAIEIKAVSRDPGQRSKVAVMSHQENIDPIGSCIGQRGSRIQTIISELGGEKIDVIQYDEDIKAFITNALSPAKVLSLELFPDTQSVKVFVAPDQLSLAIGRMGQNVRLASQLAGWNIEVQSEAVPHESAESAESVEEVEQSAIETEIIEPDIEEVNQ